MLYRLLKGASKSNKPSGWQSEYVNPYLPTQTPEEDYIILSDHMQSPGWCLIWWFASLDKIMALQDTEFPYWDQVSFNNTNQINPIQVKHCQGIDMNVLCTNSAQTSVLLFCSSVLRVRNTCSMHKMHALCMGSYCSAQIKHIEQELIKWRFVRTCKSIPCKTLAHLDSCSLS